MIIFLFPCFGSFNWLNIPFSGLGLLISIIAIIISQNKGKRVEAITGATLCAIANIIGILRLIIGFGMI